ncbi:hypothetical protein MesoLj113b_26030 [Mesorhizobium sp. 113-3-3]|nr:hypothetical protein MesoLj113b_26030 [Mesorhizobium sp. 113-3-3]
MAAQFPCIVQGSDPTLKKAQRLFDKEAFKVAETADVSPEGYARFELRMASRSMAMWLEWRDGRISFIRDDRPCRRRCRAGAGKEHQGDGRFLNRLSNRCPPAAIGCNT